MFSKSYGKNFEKDCKLYAQFWARPASRRLIFRHLYIYQCIRRKILINLRGGFDLLTCPWKLVFFQKPKNLTFFLVFFGRITEVKTAFWHTSSHRSSTNFFLKEAQLNSRGTLGGSWYSSMNYFFTADDLRPKSPLMGKCTRAS